MDRVSFINLKTKTNEISFEVLQVTKNKLKICYILFVYVKYMLYIALSMKHKARD